MITFILILLLGTGLFGYYYVSSAIKPLDAHSTKYIQVEIPSGSGNRMIGKILEKAGVIKNATVFNFTPNSVITVIYKVATIIYKKHVFR